MTQKLGLPVIVLLTLLFVGPALAAGTGTGNRSTAPTPVLFFSGGAIDDYMAFSLLTTMDSVELKGVVITNADTLPDAAMELHWKIAQFLGQTDIPVALSEARGWNAFPWQYRQDCLNFTKVDCLSPYSGNPLWPPYPSGRALIELLLAEAIAQGQKLTILVTCPITALSDVLAARPELEQGIDKLIFMAGAVYVAGNLDPTTIPAEIANDRAEWNVFWDPAAVDWIFNHTTVPIILLPLDSTNQVPVTPILDRLREQSAVYDYSRLAYQGYQLTLNEPFYRMWNSAAAVYVNRPDVFSSPDELYLSVVTQGFYQGALAVVPQNYRATGSSRSTLGRQVGVILEVPQLDGFYDYVLTQWAR